MSSFDIIQNLSTKYKKKKKKLKKPPTNQHRNYFFSGRKPTLSMIFKAWQKIEFPLRQEEGIDIKFL